MNKSFLFPFHIQYKLNIISFQKGSSHNNFFKKIQFMCILPTSMYVYCVCAS